MDSFVNMDTISLLTLSSLYVGAFITWSTEAFGSVIRLIGIAAKSNLISSSFVHSIGIFSRLGFFLQALALAWIVDEKLLMGFRYEMAIGYLVVSSFSVIFIHLFGARIIELLCKILANKIPIDAWKNHSVKIEFNAFTRPKQLQIFGYILLYSGGFFPILIQLVIPEFAARGVALASIVNGVSTIILISYYDLKTSVEIQHNGASLIPVQLVWARYGALVFLVFLCAIVYLIIPNA
jgi:hypothetical protein